MMLPLFGDAETVITAIVTGIVTLISAIGGTYALMRKSRTEGSTQESESKIKEREAEAKLEAARQEAAVKQEATKKREEKKERKDALDECWQLYNEVKSENIELKVAGRLMARKVRRLERAFQAAGLILPDLSDHDLDEDSGGVMLPPSSSEGPNGGSTKGPVPPGQWKPR